MDNHTYIRTYYNKTSGCMPLIVAMLIGIVQEAVFFLELAEMSTMPMNRQLFKHFGLPDYVSL